MEVASNGDRAPVTPAFRMVGEDLDKTGLDPSSIPARGNKCKALWWEYS